MRLSRAGDKLGYQAISSSFRWFVFCLVYVFGVLLLGLFLSYTLACLNGIWRNLILRLFSYSNTIPFSTWLEWEEFGMLVFTSILNGNTQAGQTEKGEGKNNNILLVGSSHLVSGWVNQPARRPADHTLSQWRRVSRFPVRGDGGGGAMRADTIDIDLLDRMGDIKLS